LNLSINIFRIDVPESIVSTLKYWGNKQEEKPESVEEKETVEEQPKSGDETQEGDVEESEENITQSRVDKLDAHDIHTNLAKAVLVKYMSCYDSNLKNSMNQFLFYLCDDDVDHFAREFGIGNSIGFLAEKGFLGSLMQQQVTSGSTLDEAHAAETEVQDDQDQGASGDVAE
jgi:cellobiose-specific phosphotransferase system component IIA